MEGHGPWRKDKTTKGLSAHLPRLPASVASYDLARLLYHLEHTDQMLGDLMNLSHRLPRRTVVSLYGDHLPFLPEGLEQAGFDETSTDYVIWRNDIKAAGGKRADLAPDELGREVLAAAGLVTDFKEQAKAVAISAADDTSAGSPYTAASTSRRKT